MATDLAPLDVPAKALPAPTADISPGMQAFVGAPLNPNWNKLWKTGEEARAFADKQAADTVKTIPALLERQHVKSDMVPESKEAFREIASFFGAHLGK
ncbi:MAG TPA: hypothetical protein VGG86_05315 [Roseiarcus sp.]|jgi:hypothetical protein